MAVREIHVATYDPGDKEVLGMIPDAEFMAPTRTTPQRTPLEERILARYEEGADLAVWVRLNGAHPDYLARLVGLDPSTQRDADTLRRCWDAWDDRNRVVMGQC